MTPLDDTNYINELAEWPIVCKSTVAKHTTNPIRNVVDRLRIPPNPDLPMISLGLGDPTVFGNLKTHENVVKAVQDALLDPHSYGYPPATGSIQAKEAIARRYTHLHGSHPPLTPNDIVVTSGCSGALEMSLAALASVGQTVLLPQPGFSLYRTLCDNKGIQTIYYHLDPNREWEINLEEVESHLSNDPSIVAWLINNPSNPCGSVYSKEHLTACKSLAAKYKITIIADEIYEDMVFSPNVFYPMASLSPSIPMLTCGGLAKRFLVPGWRVGWIIIHDPIPNVSAMKEIRLALTDLAGLILGANSLIQAALPAILHSTPSTFHSQTNEYLAQNASIAFKSLEGTPGIQLIRPQGAFYMMMGLDMNMVDLSDDVQFCEHLISEESVLALPGTIFGMPNFIRLVYCAPPEKVQEAALRIKRFIMRHTCTTVSNV